MTTTTPPATAQPCRGRSSSFWRAARLLRLALGLVGLHRLLSSRLPAQANSSDRIASPIGMTTNAGPGSTSIATPPSSEHEPDDAERDPHDHVAVLVRLAPLLQLADELGRLAAARGSLRSPDRLPARMPD